MHCSSMLFLWPAVAFQGTQESLASSLGHQLWVDAELAAPLELMPGQIALMWSQIQQMDLSPCRFFVVRFQRLHLIEQ